MKKNILNKSTKFISNIYIYILLIFLFAFSFVSFITIDLFKFGYYGEYFNTFLFFSICFGLMYSIFNKRINVGIHCLMFIILFISLCTSKIVPHSGTMGGTNYFPWWARLIELPLAIIGYLLIIVFSFTISKNSQTCKLFYFTKPYEKYLYWGTIIFLFLDISLSLTYYALFWIDFPNPTFGAFDVSDFFVSCSLIPYILLITIICNKRLNLGTYLVTCIFLLIGLVYVIIGSKGDTGVRHFFYVDRIITHSTGLLGLGGIVFQHYYFKIR